MTNYNNLSDAEISLKVAHAIAKENNHFFVCGMSNESVVVTKEDMFGNREFIEFDPCNNPANAWPIIVDNKISIHHSIIKYDVTSLVYDKKYDDGFKIFSHDSDVGDTSSRGALRAAMIVFLMMMEGGE